MNSLIVSAMAALIQGEFAEPPVNSQPSTTALFLQAADRNDFSAMHGLMKDDVLYEKNGKRVASAKFLASLSNCYLRRVYQNGRTNEVLAAWMCAEGPNKSRVVLAVPGEAQGKILLVIAREDRNNVSAPPRTGSAFADEGERG